MNNLSEEILMRYLTGECSDEDFARVNAWIKESDDNARRLFRMEEVYHLGRHDSFPDQKHDYAKSWLRRRHIAAKLSECTNGCDMQPSSYWL